MVEEGRKRSGGCLKAGLIGCGVVVVLGLVAVVGIATNLDLIKQSKWFRSISEGVDTAKAEMKRSLEIRQALLEKYPAEQIGVNFNFSSVNGVSVKSLAVSIQGPKFEVPEDHDELEALARGIALDVAHLHPEIGKYDQIVVQLVRRFGAATISTSADEFVFQVAELVEPAAEGGAEPPSD